MSIDIRCDECRQEFREEFYCARCIAAKVDEARIEGYDQGRTDGEAEGYRRGFAEGKTEGVMGVGEIE